MAKLWIQEFEYLGTVGQQGGVMAPMPPLVSQPPLDIGVSVEASEIFNAKTRYVRVESDVDCHIAFGVDPQPDTDAMPLFAKQPDHFWVKAGHKVGVIQAS